MAGLISDFNVHIRKQARRELKGLILDTKKRTTDHRRAIAALKREIATLRRRFDGLNKRLPGSLAPAAKDVSKSRLRVDGLKAHRLRLGLSAADYGKLLGVSSLTVYNWENRKAKPRRSQLPQIVAVRGLGKREAAARLAVG